MPGELLTLLEVVLVLGGACVGLLVIEYRKAKARQPLITDAVRWAFRHQPGVVAILGMVAGFLFGVLAGHFLWCA